MLGGWPLGLVVVDDGGFATMVVVAGGWPLGLVVVDDGGFATLVVDGWTLATVVDAWRT